MMAGPGGSAEPGLPPVLVFSPQAADAAVLSAMIGKAGLCPELPEDPERVVGRVGDAGCVVATQEALKPALLAAVARALGAQPPWSELPLIVLASANADVIRLRGALVREWPDASVVLLSRPLRAVELLSAIQLALSARMRQFRIRDQLQQERELRRELNHRVKNLLATVQAIADMTRRSASTPEEALDNFGARLEALAAVHSTLHDAIGEGATFSQLAGNVLRPYADAGGDRLTISGPEQPLAPEAAKLLGLCLHELATNAAKYGALSRDGGTVELRLTPTPGQVSMVWRETGGPPVQPPTRTGYGATFVTSALASVFGAAAETDYAPEGFRLTATGPAETLFQS